LFFVYGYRFHHTAAFKPTQRTLDIVFTINDKRAVSTVNEQLAADMASCISRIPDDNCGYPGKPLINRKLLNCAIRINFRLCRLFPTRGGTTAGGLLSFIS